MLGFLMQYEKMSEHELFECYENQPGDALKECILRKYLYIAEIVAKKFVGRGVEFDDLCVGQIDFLHGSFLLV